MVEQQDNEIYHTIESLKQAKENLNRIEKEYATEPILQEIYGFSAKEMIQNLESHLEYLLRIETESDITITSEIDSLDLWIRIEGESFHDGTGPINVVGSYLQKLNTAVRHSASLIKKKFQANELISDFLPTFELAATAKGSLKLGLQNNTPNNLEKLYKPSLFDFSITNNPTQQLEYIDMINQITTKSINVLFKALASAEDESFISELIQEYDADDVIKLIHYAQDLAPSSRSPIDFISFEGNQLRDFKNLRTDKSTRISLKQNAKKLKQNKVYVEGTAFIKQYSVDSDKPYYSLIARSFKYDNKTIDEVELRINKQDFFVSQDQVYNQLIFISGFLHFNSNNQPFIIEVDQINFDRFEEIFGE